MDGTNLSVAAKNLDSSSAENGCGVYVIVEERDVDSGRATSVYPLALVNLMNSLIAPTLLSRLLHDSFSPRLQKSVMISSVRTPASGYFFTQNSLNLRNLSIDRHVSRPEPSIRNWYASTIGDIILRRYGMSDFLITAGFRTYFASGPYDGSENRTPQCFERYLTRRRIIMHLARWV
ncbi:MAG: hypothetical protein NC453_23110 [Muribaculum sp.]|nr:hypothetical protein [Muribaculum sp.]